MSIRFSHEDMYIRKCTYTADRRRVSLALSCTLTLPFFF